MNSLLPVQESHNSEYSTAHGLQICTQVHQEAAEDLWEKGLQLAYFILPERGIALNVLREALTKLEAQHSRERKRRYWRDKNLKGKIRRITREERDALQWLLYFESEVHEKAQEASGRQTVEDMVVRYIKHLVQITTAMSSLYVQIGVHRLLHDYSTPEVRQIYELITGHHPGYAEYRKVKGALMEKLQTRFELHLRVCTGDRRELKFEAAEDQEVWNKFVDECLTMFVPWSTAHACPSLANLGSNWTGLLQFLSIRIYRKGDQDAIETRRCHAFIDPACYGEITRQLAMDHPHKRLALPKFFPNAKQNGGSDLRSLQGEDRHLTQGERTTLTAHLQAQARMRDHISPTLLMFVAHGNICAKLDLTRTTIHSFELRDGVKLIEIWAEEGTDRALLATHWIRYREWQGMAPETAFFKFGHKMRLSLRVTPRSSGDESTGALVQVECRKGGLLVKTKELLGLSTGWNGQLPKFAAAALLTTAGLAVGWLAGKARSAFEVSKQSARIEQMTKELAALRSAPQGNGREVTATSAVRLIPDTTSTREHGASEPVASIRPDTQLLSLELPVHEHQEFVYRATLTGFFDSKEIITEDGLIAKQVDRGTVVTFALPAAVVRSSGDYVVHLRARDISGRLQTPLNFTFYIEKK